MDWRISLLAITLLATLGVGASAPADAHALKSMCPPLEAATGGCPGTSASGSGDGATLTGIDSSTDPGTSGRRHGAPSTPVGLTGLGVPTLDSPWDHHCTGNLYAPCVLAQSGTPAKTITISDVARLLVTRGTIHSEPDGWAAIGTPTNFWADVQTSIAHGTLLGKRVEVRFTPVAYRWDYGDGATATTTDGGASWKALGQDELTATSTSHVYAARMTTSASVDVLYSAQYRVGGGAWRAVNGAVEASTPAIALHVVTEATALTTG